MLKHSLQFLSLERVELGKQLLLLLSSTMIRSRNSLETTVGLSIVTRSPHHVVFSSTNSPRSLVQASKTLRT